ncbi:nuclease-related domain-containing protein [Nonomuraea dietziae]|uniref:nuclease-related domain-containing protein n=1 Tax=Nonomuraea dietziae TaxID=65515 RepID=UPI0031DAA907
MLHNIEIPRGADLFEVDLIVLTGHSVVVIDVKGTRGRIEVSGQRWFPPAQGGVRLSRGQAARHRQGAEGAPGRQAQGAGAGLRRQPRGAVLPRRRAGRRGRARRRQRHRPALPHRHPGRPLPRTARRHPRRQAVPAEDPRRAQRHGAPQHRPAQVRQLGGRGAPRRRQQGHRVPRVQRHAAG